MASPLNLADAWFRNCPNPFPSKLLEPSRYRRSSTRQRVSTACASRSRPCALAPSTVHTGSARLRGSPSDPHENTCSAAFRLRVNKNAVPSDSRTNVTKVACSRGEPRDPARQLRSPQRGRLRPIPSGPRPPRLIGDPPLTPADRCPPPSACAGLARRSRIPRDTFWRGP